MIDKIFPKLHNEGYRFIVIFVVLTIVLYLINGFLGFIGLVLTIWCYYFFRDPDRVSIEDENYLISPADGEVLQILYTNVQNEHPHATSAMAGPSVALLNDFAFFSSFSYARLLQHGPSIALGRSSPFGIFHTVSRSRAFVVQSLHCSQRAHMQ